MLGTLSPEQNKHLKLVYLLWLMPTTVPRIHPLGAMPTILLFLREPRLSVDVEFDLQNDGQKLTSRKSIYIEQFKRRIKYAHKKAKHMASRYQKRHKGLYDLRCRGLN